MKKASADASATPEAFFDHDQWIFFQKRDMSMAYVSLLPESFKLCLKNGTMIDTPGTPTTEINLNSARGDTCAVQLLIRSDVPAAVLLTDAPCFSVQTRRTNLRISGNGPFKPRFLDIGMLPDDDETLRADPLLEADAVELEPGVYHTFCVLIPIPEDTAPGSYNLNLEIHSNTMFSPEIPEQTLTVRIKAADVPLPGKEHFILDLWQHLTNIAHKHDVTLWSDDHFQVLEHYVSSLAQLGQKSVTVIASEVPWAGQGCHTVPELECNLFEYSMIGVERLPDGTLHCNFDPMDRYIALCAKYGIDREIEVFGLTGIWGNAEEGFGPLAEDYEDPIRIRCYDHATRTFRYLDCREDIDTYIRLLSEHFEQTGMINSVRLVADEPADAPKYRRILEHLHSIAPQLRMKSAINHAGFIEAFHDLVDAFAPNLECVSNEYDLLTQFIQEYPEKDFVWYLCSWPRTFNTFLKSHLLETRFLGTLTSVLGFHGFLRWNYTVWPKDPRRDIRYAPFPAGDLNFVYPGANGKPLLSLRYLQLKRGIEDFSLLWEAKHLGLSDTVNQVYELLCRCTDPRKIYSGKGILPPEEICSLSWEDYEQARRLLLGALSQK